MRFQQKTILGGLALCIFLTGLTIGCSKNENVVSPYVQDIVPAHQKPTRWDLSPSGDKLLYNTMLDSNQAIVRFLATGQEFSIAECSKFRWLDNESVYCYDFRDQHYVPSVVIGNISSNAGGDFQKTSVKAVTAEQVELELLLKQAKTIYKLHRLTEPDSFLVLDVDSQENLNQYYHITEIENLDKVLENYTYTTIPLHDHHTLERSEKVYSPNRDYYYLLQDDYLRIYDAASNKILVEFKPSSDYQSFFLFGGNFPNKSEGWQANSSSVYFQIFHPSGFGPPAPIEPIQKLCVPGAPGCPPTN